MGSFLTFFLAMGRGPGRRRGKRGGGEERGEEEDGGGGREKMEMGEESALIFG